MKKIILIAIGFVGLVSGSCKKDRPDPPIDEYYFITDNSWKLTSLTVDPAHQGISNVLATWEDCRLDDIYRFRRNLQLEVLSGAQLCSPSEPSLQIGSWSGTAGWGQLIFSLIQLPWEAEPHQVTGPELNTNQFTLTEYKVHEGVSHRYNWVFTKQ